MRKFTTLILTLLMLTLAFPFVGWAQGFIPVGEVGSCNKPTIVYFNLEDEYLADVENSFVAKVLSNGYLDSMCQVYYEIYYEDNLINRLSDYGSLRYHVRGIGSSVEGGDITSSSGLVSVTVTYSSMSYTVSALSLGIVDGYCPASTWNDDLLNNPNSGRNRPVTFYFDINQYGHYKIRMQIRRCKNTSGSISDLLITAALNSSQAQWPSYNNGKPCCPSGSRNDKASQSTCNSPKTIYQYDIEFDVVSTKILAHPQGGEICLGGSKTLEVQAETNLSAGLTYQWYKDGAAISGATANTYEATVAGTYYCVTNDGRVTRQTNDAVVTVTPMPEVALAADQYICPNGTLDITMPAGATYVWSTGATGQNLNVTAPGTYGVTMTSNGCTAAHSFNVQNSPAVNLLADDPVSFCYGATETLSLAVNNATNIVWNGDAANNGQNLTISEGGTYTVAADVNGCHFTDTVVATRGENVNLINDENINMCYGESRILSLAVNNASNIVWNDNPNDNNQSFVALGAGTYTVAADVNGCRFTDQVVVNQSEHVDLITEQTKNLCYGGTTTLELAVDNAEDIMWNYDDLLNQNTLEISESGKYRVSASVNGCYFTDSIIVVQSENVDLISAQNVELCYGATETLSLAVDNATDIVWAENPANNAATYEISGPGVYTVSAKIGECSYTDQIVATQTENINLVSQDTVTFCYGTSEELNLAVNNATNIIWNSDNSHNATYYYVSETGTYTVSAKIGECTYTDQIVAIRTDNVELLQFDSIQFCYGSSLTLTLTVDNAENIIWNNDDQLNQNSLVISELGKYRVSAMVDGCYYSDSIVAIETQYFDLIPEESVIICAGSTTTISVPSNAQNVVWNGNDELNGTSLEINVPGPYTVAADYNGCRYNDQVDATIAPELYVTISAEDINCNGGTTTAVATATGGVEPYSFVWNNGETTQNITVSADTYYVTVTDNNRCMAVADLVITEPRPLTVTINAGTINCFGGTTTAVANVNGGVSPYAITWSTLEEATSITAMAGIYTVTVIDSNECTEMANVTITQPEVLTVTIDAETINCYGGTTTALANVNGGTAPYAITWSTMEEATTITATAGNYTVTVIDSNECTETANAVITQPDALSVTINAGTIGCDVTTTTAVAVAEGGVAPYAFAWSNQEYTQNITDIVPGNYSVTVTDDHSCSAMTNVVVTEPAMLSVSIDAGTINCHGGTTTVEANVTGGTTPYALAWSNNENTLNINAAAGEYSVIVTDANGCSATASTTIEEPAELTVSIIAGAINCHGGTTMAVAHANGGVSPYLYAWSNQGTAQNISNIVAGNYSVTVVDNHECSVTATTTITEPEYVNLIADETVNFCEGSSVTVTLVDGATNVVWSNSEVGANNEIGIAGTYTVSADVNGCTYTDQVDAVERPLPESGLNHEYSYVIHNSADTTIVISANADYDMYLWSDGSTDNSLTINCDTLILPFNADYNLTITTEYGCSVVDTVSVHVEMSSTSISEFETSNWSVVPNPSDGKFNIVGPNFDKAEMFDADGRLLHTIEVENVNILDLKPGMYYLRIYSGNMTSIQKVIINRQLVCFL